MKKINGIVGILCGAVVIFGGVASAEGTITEKYSSGREMLFYIKNIDGIIEEAEAQIGTEMAEAVVPLGKVTEQSEYHIQTMILLDNSFSIKSNGRDEKIKELLKAIINGHAQGEEFSINTFSTSISSIAEYSTDYNNLCSTVDNIQYYDQDAYLVDAIYQSVEKLMDDQNANFKRLVVISDGVDDNKGEAGYTSSELIGLLEEKGCPIYTIGCKWDKDQTGLGDLFSYSRKAGGESFELDTIENMNDIVSIIQKDYGTQILDVEIPLNLLDGGSRKIHFDLQTSNGSDVAERTVTTPFVSASQVEAWKQEEQTKLDTETEEDKVFEETVTEQETITEKISEIEEEKSWKEKLPVSTSVLSGIVVGIIGLMGVFTVYGGKGRKESNKKKKDEDKEEVEKNQQKPFSKRKDDFADESEDKTILLDRQDIDDDGGTIYLWNMPGKKKIVLKNIHTSESYEHVLDKKLIVGRKEGLSDIAIKGDRAISGKHCEIYSENGEIYMADMGSSNGTKVNDEEIQDRIQLHNGDILKIGVTELMITIDE